MINKYLIILYFIWCCILSGCVTEQHKIKPKIKNYVYIGGYKVNHDRGDPFTVDSEGNFYITNFTDDSRMRIKKYNSQGKYIKCWVPEIIRRKKNCWFLNRRNPPFERQLTDILADEENIYLSYVAAYGSFIGRGYSDDYTSHIEQYNLNGKFITARKPEEDTFSMDFVRHIIKDKNGNFHVAFWQHIEKYDANWKFQSVSYPFKQNKWYTTSKFSEGTIIGDLAVDTEGYTYILISGLGCVYSGAIGHIYKFDSSYNIIKEWKSDGKDKFMAQGLEIDPDNNIYMLETDSNKTYRIQEFDSNLNFIIKWDFEGDTMENNGTTYTDMKIDSKGNIYVDSGNGKIKKFSPKQ
ncbi:MAG: hypothetical protein ABRQ38_26975 [Candidatus Eremiobacterota bacterium]